MRRLTPKERTAYLANAKGMTATSTTALEMVNRLRDNHPGPQELVDRIFQECIRNIEPAGEMGPDSGDEALLHQKGSPLGRARAFATLCRAAKVPARLVTGFEIKKETRARRAETIRPRTWVEVYVADPQKPAVGRWVPYDPENGSLHELDYNIVPVRRDGVELIRVTNSTDLYLLLLDRKHSAGDPHRPGDPRSSPPSGQAAGADQGGLDPAHRGLVHRVGPDDYRHSHLRHLFAHAAGPGLRLQRLAERAMHLLRRDRHGFHQPHILGPAQAPAGSPPGHHSHHGRHAHGAEHLGDELFQVGPGRSDRALADGDPHEPRRAVLRHQRGRLDLPGRAAAD